MPWAWVQVRDGGPWHMVTTFAGDQAVVECRSLHARVPADRPVRAPAHLDDGRPCAHCLARLRRHIDWWAGLLAEVEAAAESGAS